jgi:hypothetical protein
VSKNKLNTWTRAAEGNAASHQRIAKMFKLFLLGDFIPHATNTFCLHIRINDALACQMIAQDSDLQ